MILLWYIMLIVTTAACQKDIPDITLLSTVINNMVSHTCVAGSNTEDSAITFITPVGSTYPENTPELQFESKYISEGIEILIDAYDCDFEPESNCAWQWTAGYITVESAGSGTNFQEPVLDERWEKFTTFSHLTNPVTHIFNSENTNIGISVRTGGVASVVLCSDGAPMQCYWITLNENNKLLKLSYCPQVYYSTTNFKEENFRCKKISLQNETKVTLSEKNWNHFILSTNRIESTIIKICDNRPRIGCMEYEAASLFSIKTMYLHLQVNKRGFWKIHNYGYLSLNQGLADGQWHALGPELQPQGGVLCVTLHAMCEACKLSFKFSNEKIEVSTDSINQWKHIKLIVSNAGLSSYKLQVKGTPLGTVDYAGFLFIDDVRRCHLSETRIIITSTPMSDRETVSCVALKKPNWSSTNVAGKVGTTVNGICKNSRYIGNNCDISCSSVMGMKQTYCNKHIICKPTKKPTEPKCSCSAGHYEEQCNEICPVGFYGYNCLTACEPCRGYCGLYSGVCPPDNTCSTDDGDPGCNLAGLLQLLAPPDIIKSTLTTITLKPRIKEKKPNAEVLYQIEYKCNSMTSWKPHGEKTMISELKETTLTDLTPLTEYRIRMVLYRKDNNTYNTSPTDHIFKSVTTTCNNISPIIYFDILKIEGSSTYVKITWTPICNGTMQFNIKYSNQNSSTCNVVPSVETTSVTSGYITIGSLIPSQEYVLEIVAKNEDQETSIQLETFSTTESEWPLLRSPPEISSTTLTTITINFDRKDIIKENKAQKFIVQYRETSKSHESYWKSSPKNDVDMRNEYELNNLTMNTSYEIRVVFYTHGGTSYYTCIPIATANSTCTDLSKLELIKELKVQPSKTRATVTWATVCENTFKIKISCGEDSWCDNPPKSLKFSSLSNKQVISGLIPFTYYNMEFSVINQQNNKWIETRTFQTKPAAPPLVTELQVYSFDTDCIKIRFKKPYPPYGELSAYEYSACSVNYFITVQARPITCPLWDEFQCLEINGIFEETCNNFHIRATNKNVQERGYASNTTIKRKTEPPRNLSVNKIVQEVCWEHPDFTRGTLEGFQITIKQIETARNIRSLNETDEISETYTISMQKEYCYKIEHQLLLSSEYNITVQGINKIGLGQPALTQIFTLPIEPMLEGNITVGERTNTTQTIIIPLFKAATSTNNSAMYVVVCDPTSGQPKQEASTPLDLKDNLRSQSGCQEQGTFWVAGVLKANETEFTVENLETHVNYTISVLLVNEYHNERSISLERYSIITSAPWIDDDPGLGWYALFLLLLIVPVVGFFAYRKYHTPRGLPQSGTSFEEVTGQNNNVPMRNFFNSISRNIPNRKSENLPIENEEPLINEPSYTALVKIANLSQYVKESLENGELEKQHALFPKGGTKPWEYGMVKENKFKNRYNNLTAYDHSRVVLKKMHGDPFSDFINANYIDGYKKSRAYIATQGPKPSTLNDFWRMIWQENVKYIVMLANLVEGNKPKCEKYWPELGSTQDYYNVAVTFLQTDIYADFEYRSFEVTCDGQSRKIQHLHFTSWPDHGVPQYPQSLVPFLRKILTIPLTTPIVVHCSAGVGRTGTIILADICLRMAAVEGQVDVLKYMHSIREQRAKLVDNFDQYKLVHMVLLECLLAPETSLPCENLAKAIDELVQQGGLEKQMAYLKDTAWHSQVMKGPMRIEIENVSKNRFPDIVPSVRRIYISRYPYEDEYSDYINAIPVDGFRIKDQFIVTQTPLPHTVKDFWRMIFENNVKVIVSLNEIIINDKSCCIFWPLENGQYKPVPYLTLNYISIKEGANYDTYNVQLINTSENSTSNVNIIQYKNWKREQVVPDDIDTLIRVVEEAQNLSRQGDPLVVACYNGSSASGLFVALSFIIEKMKLEQICDVCQAVRAIRINRSQFVSHRKQFEFLYQAAVQYVASFDDYSNFEGPRKT